MTKKLTSIFILVLTHLIFVMSVSIAEEEHDVFHAEKEKGPNVVAAPITVSPGQKMQRRNPSLEELGIQSVRLGMSSEDVDSMLKDADWKLVQKNSIKSQSIYKKEDKSLKSLVIDYAFFPDKSIGGIIKIQYSQEFNQEDYILDTEKVRDSIIDKYGKPDNELVNANLGFTELQFSDYKHIPTHADAMNKCAEYLVEQGLSGAVARQKAAIYVPKPNKLTPTSIESYRRMVENCPKAEPIYNNMLEALLAPTLKAQIQPAQPGINVQMEWTRPIYEFNKELTQANMEQLKERTTITEVDL